MCGPGIEPRNSVQESGVPTLSKLRKATLVPTTTQVGIGLRAVEDPVHAQKLHAQELGDPKSDLDGWCQGPRRESQGSKTAMNSFGKSDEPILPEKSANKSGDEKPPAERMEGRGSAKGNPGQQTRLRTQGRDGLQHALDRIRQAATREKRLRFTTLWHHICHIDRLREEYFHLRPNAAPGVDGQTWEKYGEHLETNLRDLSDRLKRGAYRAKPVKRAYIPKADGRQRPIGIPTLEDKIVQRAAGTVMEAIYEVDFKGFSYGFRPKRGAHQALDALTVGITERKVSWILDADIRGFFDAIDHDWLVKFIEHRIADRRLIRHIKKWLAAGVLEDGERCHEEKGTPQGGSISPVLANVYLHYVLDLWISHWRQRKARGDVIIVRYSDDFVVGFQYQSDAVRFLVDLKERLRKFHLELQADKTRLIEFGRFAAERRSARGEDKPETFNFLGFTHICGKTIKQGKFIVVRRPIKARVGAEGCVQMEHIAPFHTHGLLDLTRGLTMSQRQIDNELFSQIFHFA